MTFTWVFFNVKGDGRQPVAYKSCDAHNEVRLIVVVIAIILSSQLF